VTPLIVRGGDGKPKGEILDAPKGSRDIVMNRHNRRKLAREKMPRATRRALAQQKRGW